MLKSPSKIEQTDLITLSLSPHGAMALSDRAVTAAADYGVRRFLVKLGDAHARRRSR